PRLRRLGQAVRATHASLGEFEFQVEADPDNELRWLFTENETNSERLFGVPSNGRFTKDAFHRAVTRGEDDAVNPDETGTKAAAHLRIDVPAGESRVVRCRLAPAPNAGGAVKGLADVVREGASRDAAGDPF